MYCQLSELHESDSDSWLTPGDPAMVHALARRLVYFALEPLVIDRLIESAEFLGRHEEARVEAEHFSVALPHKYRR